MNFNNDLDTLLIFIVIYWLGTAIVMGFTGANRRIGFAGGFLASLFLSPLIAAVLIVGSKRKETPVKIPAEVSHMLRQARKEKAEGNLDGAIRDFMAVLPLVKTAPNTHFALACLYSLKSQFDDSFRHLALAVQQGFNNFTAIQENPDLAALRKHRLWSDYSRSGFKALVSPSHQPIDPISQLERLAELRGTGVLTEDEFQEQKRGILQHGLTPR